MARLRQRLQVLPVEEQIRVAVMHATVMHHGRDGDRAGCLAVRALAERMRGEDRGACLAPSCARVQPLVDAIAVESAGLVGLASMRRATARAGHWRRAARDSARAREG